MASSAAEDVPAEAARADLVATFSAVTGAAPSQAERVLAAHGWSLEVAAQLYLEGGGADVLDQAGGPAAEHQLDPPPPPLQEEEEEQHHHHHRQQQRQQQQEQQQEQQQHEQQQGGGDDPDQLMSDAEAFALATARQQRPEPQVGSAFVDLTADEGTPEADAERDLNAAIAASLQDAGGAAPGLVAASLQDAGGAAPGASLRHVGSGPSLQRPPNPPLQPPSGADPGGSGEGLRVDGTAALPPDGGLNPEVLKALGVDPEEARMLEAAMLDHCAPNADGDGGHGLPSNLHSSYEATVERAIEAERRRRESIARAEADAPPEVAMQRSLRAEQDAALAASLLADRQKASASEAAARAEREARAAASRAEREASEAAARAERAAAAAAAQAEADSQRRREAAAARVPAAPAEGAEGVVRVMVRLPQGGRLTRAFASSDCLLSLFDWVAAEGADGGSDAAKLVTQFPRRVMQRASDAAGSTLGELGFQRQESFFLQIPGADD